MLSQEAYVNALLGKFKMTNCKGAAAPKDGHIRLNIRDTPIKDEQRKECLKLPYKELVGSLIYLMNATRPDLAYAVSQLIKSRFMSNYGVAHWTAAKRVFQYLKRSKSRMLLYRAGSEPLCDSGRRLGRLSRHTAL